MLKLKKKMLLLHYYYTTLLQIKYDRKVYHIRSQRFSHYQPVLVLDFLQARYPGVASEVLRRRIHQAQRQDPLLLSHRVAPQVHLLLDCFRDERTLERSKLYNNLVQLSARLLPNKCGPLIVHHGDMCQVVERGQPRHVAHG